MSKMLKARKAAESSKLRQVEGFTSVRPGEKKAKLFNDEPAFVTYKSGQTIPIGSYSSVRVEIGITMPCHVKDVKKTLEAIRGDVIKALKVEVKKLTEQSAL